MLPYRCLLPKGILFLALLIALTASGHAGETYTSQEVLWAPWGSDPGQFGLIEEAEGVGPQSLCLDRQGNIWVLDLVNHRVQIFTPQGDFLRQVAFGLRAHDLCLNQEGELYLLAPYHGLVEKFDSQGHSLARWSISPQIWLIDGIGCAQGRVVLRTARQVEYAIANAKGPLSAEEQLEAVHQGLGGPDATRRYQTRWVNDRLGLLQFLDVRGHKLREVRVTTRETLGSLVFVGTDGDGNVYLRAEILGAGEEVKLQVLKYDALGSLLAEFEPPVNGFTYLYRDLRVHHNGDLYQLLTDPDGVRVLRWRAVPQLREERR